MAFKKSVHLPVIILVSVMSLTTLLLHTSGFRQAYGKIDFILIIGWTAVIAGLLHALFRKDREIANRTFVLRLSDVSAAATLELRRVSAAVISSSSRGEAEKNLAVGLRAILNLAHEYFSFSIGENCTASIAAIEPGEDWVKTIYYDDFVPRERRDQSVAIPVHEGIFGHIITRKLRSFIVDDYTHRNYPGFETPNIGQGYYVSGICTPITVFDNITAFFNLDSTKRNAFVPDGDEAAAVFFAELIAQLFQVGEFSLQVFKNEPSTEIIRSAR